jgi:hypothetical protein
MKNNNNLMRTISDSDSRNIKANRDSKIYRKKDRKNLKKLRRRYKKLKN